MDALARRREEDIAKLNALATKLSGKLRVAGVHGKPVARVELELKFRTAGTMAYPNQVQTQCSAVIELSARYPFHEPSILITTPIVHPNVYSSGRVCLGTKWIPTEGLDLLARRLIRIITFDPEILNANSPANRDALTWYEEARRRHPKAFPTDVVRFETETAAPKVKWGPSIAASNSPERVIVPCPFCKANLRVPTGRAGTIKCPQCNKSFESKT